MNPAVSRWAFWRRTARVQEIADRLREFEAEVNDEADDETTRKKRWEWADAICDHQRRQGLDGCHALFGLYREYAGAVGSSAATKRFRDIEMRLGGYATRPLVAQDPDDCCEAVRTLIAFIQGAKDWTFLKKVPDFIAEWGNLAPPATGDC